MKATGLQNYDEACKAIAACHRVDEVKDWRDKARALEVYAAQAQNVELENKALKIRLRAERRAGQMLKESGRRPEDGRPEKGCTESTLSDLGISKRQSSDWQKMAEHSDEEFERALSGSTKPTTKNIASAKRNEKPAPDPNHTKALWVWGRLKDFERHSILDAEVDAVWESMEHFMQDDVLRLSPLVERWLRRLRS